MTVEAQKAYKCGVDCTMTMHYTNYQRQDIDVEEQTLKT